MRKIRIIIPVLLVLFTAAGVFAASDSGSATDASGRIYSSVSVGLVVRQGVAGGFVKSQVFDVSPVADTNRLTGSQSLFVYDDATQRFVTKDVYYYLQVFIPDPIKYSISCGPLLNSEDTVVIPVADMTLNIGSDTADPSATGTDGSGNATLVLSYEEALTDDVFSDVLNADGTSTGERTRTYPTVYSSPIDVRVDAEDVKTSAVLYSTLTLSVTVIT